MSRKCRSGNHDPRDSRMAIVSGMIRHAFASLDKVPFPYAPRPASAPESVAHGRDLFGRWPAFLNGHKHCHARPELATPVMQTAQQIGAPVRSVNPDHRQWLRERNIDTPDLLIGRTESKQPAEPPEVRDPPLGVTEWMVHPGHADSEAGSSYDLARQEDLSLLQKIMLRARYDEPVWGDARRVSMKEAFAQERAT